jgi:hypothetical protein
VRAKAVNSKEVPSFDTFGALAPQIVFIGGLEF